MRHRLPLLALTALLCLARPPFACPPAAAGTMRAERPALAFFSSVTEQEFARLQAASIAPATRRHGPFRMPAPGFEIDTPALHLLDLRCAPGDWAKVVETFAGWLELPAARPAHLALPDGRLFVFAGPPRTGRDALSGLVYLVGAGARPTPTHMLRVAHDGASALVVELSPPRERPALSPDAEPPSED